MSLSLPAPTSLTRRYLRDFLFRATVFLIILGVYLYDKTLLDITAQRELFWPLSLLWIAVLVSMLAQLNPRSKLTTGCMKQYVSGYVPVANYDREKLKHTVREQNRGALKVAVVWLLVNGCFGLLYLKKIFSAAELILLCALYYLCDLICVLFFCPFQTFLMKNRCCVNCRIFAWGSWMMAVPLVFLPHPYARSLVAASVLVLAVWEYRFYKYPQRFWFGSNCLLQCGNCKEQLCRYKVPSSPKFAALKKAIKNGLR
ncbi:MAG: hypothetical protein IJZ52_05230 [Clostridium sp.]|nr:hypothetical protein [Clostridium sp.]